MEAVDSSVSAGQVGSSGKIDTSSGYNSRRDWLIGVGVSAFLTLIFGLVNWHWLQVNVVTYGWDRMDHLITTLVFNNMLAAPGPTTLYDLLAYASYYPPLVHYIAAAAYQIFGAAEEIAVMTNLLYLFVLLFATGAIARQLEGTANATTTGVLAMLLLATFPMIFAMSRYLYLDFALTALVAVSVAFLLYSERLSRRGPALWFGLAIGLAFLVKWTTAAFLIGPLVYVVWRSGVVPKMFRHPRELLPNWRRLLLALVAGALLNLVWLYPARDGVAANPVGWWLYPVFSLLLGGVLYALFAARRDGDGVAQALNNALSSAVIGSWIIALWYLTNTEFIDSFSNTAYGLDGGRFLAYGKYFREVTTEQLGLFYTIFFVLIVVVWLVQQRRHLLRSLTNLSDTAWVLLLWIVVPTIIFSTQVSLAHSRFIMPFLPPFAIWMAAGLMMWRPPLLRWAAIGLILIVAVAQFAFISFDELADWRTRFTVSVAGQPVDLLANGFFIQYPASGINDPDYAIAADVLDIVDQARLDQDRETIELGILTNLHQLHEKHFLYQIYINYPQVRLRELARNWREQSAYNQLFEMDYVLVSDTHSYRTHESSQEVVNRILAEESDLFNLAFQPVQAWDFPSGEHLTLYGRRYTPTEPGLAPEDYYLLLESLLDPASEGDAIALVGPDQAYMMGLLLPDEGRITVAPLPAEGESAEETRTRLTELAAANQRIFLIRHNTDQADPDGTVEQWLDENLIRGSDVWLNSLQVTPYVVAGDGDPRELPVNVTWLDGPKLAGVTYRPTTTVADEATPGGALVLDLAWESLPDTPRKVSLQLLSPEGTLVAQNDQEISEDVQQFVLLVPHSTVAGDYALTVTVYDPNNGERFPLEDGSEVLQIDTVVVQ